MKEIEEILAELKSLVGEELKSVSYKWLAREYELPVNLAKQLLFQFANEHRGKVNITYLLAGWTKEPSRQHTFQLVDGSRLQESRKQLDPITSLHVYSVQPSQPQDPAALWNADSEQRAALFDSMVKQMAQNCLSDNRLSAVVCPEAKRDPELAKKLPAPPVAQQPDPAEKPIKGVAAKIDGILAGSTGSNKGVASASVALGNGAAQRKDAFTKGPASAPAAAGKGSGLASMWSKAPPKKAAAKKVDKQAPAANASRLGAMDADAALDMAQQDATSSEDDEDVSHRPAKRKAGQQVFDDDEAAESDGGAGTHARSGRSAVGAGTGATAGPAAKKPRATAEPAAKKPRATADPAAKRPRATIVVDSDSDDAVEAVDEEKPAAAAEKKAPAKRSRKQQADADEEGVTTEAAGPKKGRAKEASERPAFGSVKSGAAAGSKRQRVSRTTILDTGEEVTEDVWEDGEASQAAPAEPRSHKSSPAVEAVPAADGGATVKVGPAADQKSEPNAQAKRADPPKAPAKKSPAKKLSDAKGGSKKQKTMAEAAARTGQKKIQSFFQKR